MTRLNCDLSFDPRDRYQAVPGSPSVRWAVQVFTTDNAYRMDLVAAPHLTDEVPLVPIGRQTAPYRGSVSVQVASDGDAWTFDISARHEEPIKSVKLILRGLPEEDLAAGWWSPTTARGEVAHPPLQWNYPSAEWSTRWAAAGRVAVSLRSDQVSGAALHVATPPYASGPEVELVHAVPATAWQREVTVPTMRVALAEDEAALEADFERHLASVRSGFDIPEWETRTDVPAWARDLELVVTLHGQHWTGHVFHTFDEMAGLLHRLSALVDPERVLVYLPGWEGRYYHVYPDYSPGESLGGAAGFERLASSARALGFHLMPMFGANGANVRRYPDWQRAVIRNPSNRYPILLNSPDWDGDRYPEGDQVFLNPGEPGFREHLVSGVARTVERFGVEAAFFDTASFWFDDPRYPLYDGYRALVRDLNDRFPDLLLVSEGWWDAMTALFPVSQQWLGAPRDIRLPQVLVGAARTTSHLAEGTPGTGSTGVHEEGFRPYRRSEEVAAHIPVVSFAGGDGAAQLAEVARLLGGARAPSAVVE